METLGMLDYGMYRWRRDTVKGTHWCGQEGRRAYGITIESHGIEIEESYRNWRAGFYTCMGVQDSSPLHARCDSFSF